MKSTGARVDHEKGTDELLREYRFDYRSAKPNRFADRMGEGPVVVILDPDVAEVFATPDAVNKALRALIEAFPKKATLARGAR